MGIVSPRDGSIFALDPDIPPAAQRITFEGERGTWVLDGKRLGTAQRRGGAPWSGVHELVLLGRDGKSLQSVRFEVRGGEAEDGAGRSAGVDWMAKPLCQDATPFARLKTRPHLRDDPIFATPFAHEEMRRRLAEEFGAGYHYAYLLPGIRKVVQAAGRVIRTTSDHGSVHLIDDRFARPEVLKLLPSWWRIQTDAHGPGSY